MTLTFQPNAVVNVDDPAIGFSGGGRTLNFTVPANGTQPVFPTGFDSLIQTGTTAGTITITTVLRTGTTELNRATNTIVVPRMAPVITDVRVTRIASGFNVEVRGFSTTRELTQGTFRFGGTNLGTTEVIVPVNTQFQQYFSSQQSSQFGSQFLLTQPFTITGDANAVTSVTVILTNTVGASQPSSRNF